MSLTRPQMELMGTDGTDLFNIEKDERNEKFVAEATRRLRRLWQITQMFSSPAVIGLPLR